MTWFDLLFPASAAAAAGTLGAAAWLAVRGERRRARRTLGRLLAAAAIYMTFVVALSLAVPRRVARIGERECFDDWCVAVEGFRREARDGRAAYRVELRLASRALRVTQRERNLAVYLTDERGRRWDAVDAKTAAPFDVALGPGDSVVVSRTFVAPADAGPVGLAVTHEGGFPVGWLIAGYDTGFRKPAGAWLR